MKLVKDNVSLTINLSQLETPTQNLDYQLKYHSERLEEIASTLEVALLYTPRSWDDMLKARERVGEMLTRLSRLSFNLSLLKLAKDLEEKGWEVSW